MYKITVEEKIVENKQRTVYGIMYNDECFVTDVSNDKAEVERMVELFNDNDLAPCHLLDVLEDMIG